MSAGKCGRYKAEAQERVERRERLELRNKVETKKKHGGLSEGTGTKTYFHGPMDFAKTLKVRCRVGDLDLRERRKRYIPVAGRRRK